MSVQSIALNRFGLGARSDEAPPADPKRWLIAQFDQFEPKPPALAAVPSGADAVGALKDYQMERREAKQDAAAAMPPQPAAAGQTKPKVAATPEVRQARNELRDSYIAQARARSEAAVVSPAPFAERLVHFWANHFAVSADKLVSISTAGTLEFEAIRPHLTGRFSDMVLAVEHHPAMLLYLDQAQSVGPNSPLGLRVAARQANRKIGLNENLAREIMELHTLGVGSGYTQADVTEFARAMTGWSIGGYGRGPLAQQGTPGAFAFHAALHEPGERTVLGKRYDQDGEAQGRAVLLDLAASPATAKHVSTKLARHFVSDDPPSALVDRLTQDFLRTRGDLMSLYKTLVDAPEAWSPQAAKFKSPWDWSISSVRALGAKTVDARMIGMVTELGQPIWRPGSPAGWADTTATWAGPDALVRRVEMASRLATMAGDRIDARALGPKILPGALSDTTQQLIARADSGTQALAMLLTSPEFQRR